MGAVRRLLGQLVLGLGVLIVAGPAVAGATPRSISFTYYCTSTQCSPDKSALAPPPGPTFNPQPPPNITAYGVVVTYDPAAGVVTYTQTQPDYTYAFDPNYCDDNPGNCDYAGNPTEPQTAAVWANLGQWTLSHGEYTPGSDSGPAVTFDDGGAAYDGAADWTQAGQEVPDTSNMPSLSETGVRGSLAPVPTVSATGNAITFTWSSPLLSNLGLTEVSSDTGGQFIDLGPGYFAGYLPKPPPPQVPTNYTDPQVRPYVLTVSGDGSWFFGGKTGHRLEPRSLKRIGRLHWTQYTATSATATGEAWSLYGTGSFGADRQFEAQGTVALYLYRPQSSVFTRMRVHTGPVTYRAANGRVFHYHASTATFKATYSNGSWYW